MAFRLVVLNVKIVALFVIKQRLKKDLCKTHTHTHAIEHTIDMAQGDVSVTVQLSSLTILFDSESESRETSEQKLVIYNYKNGEYLISWQMGAIGRYYNAATTVQEFQLSSTMFKLWIEEWDMEDEDDVKAPCWASVSLTDNEYGLISDALK